jgi:hypothetical protein
MCDREAVALELAHTDREREHERERERVALHARVCDVEEYEAQLCTREELLEARMTDIQVPGVVPLPVTTMP